MNSSLYVLDDDHNLVSLTTDLLYAEEDEESEEDTLKDLNNRVFFYLYTTNNRQRRDTISINDLESLKKSNFNFNRPTYIITHGWMNSHNSDSCVLIRDGESYEFDEILQYNYFPNKSLLCYILSYR